MDSIRTLDAQPLSDLADDKAGDFCREFVDCLSNQGFVKLTNHGIPHSMIEDAFDWNKQFFSLPNDTKNLIAHPPRANPNRGWSGLGQEKSSAITDFEKGNERDEDVFDMKEAFDMGAPDDPLYTNFWLQESSLPGFRSFMEKYYATCQSMHMAILSALEKGFRDRGIVVDLVNRCIDNVSELRLNYYPEIDVSKMRLGKMSRISKHTDFGTVTLLFQDSVGGLEVENQSNFGSYIPVTLDSKYEVLVNIGDSLQRLTNDALTSVSHQVTVPIGDKEKEQGLLPERYSTAYFAKVSRNESLKPISIFVAEGKEAKYKEMTAFELNQAKLAKIYG